MKTVRMSLITKSGKIANEWNVPYVRRQAALEHAMDRAEEEGHAGVLWGVVENGVIQGFAFDSHDPGAILRFASAIQPYMTQNGFDIDRFLGRERSEGVTASAAVSRARVSSSYT